MATAMVGGGMNAVALRTSDVSGTTNFLGSRVCACNCGRIRYLFLKDVNAVMRASRASNSQKILRVREMGGPNFFISHSSRF